MIPRTVLLILLLPSLAAQSDPGKAPAVPDADTTASALPWARWDTHLADLARKAGKPVYVFIGSSLSELSRSTVRETLGRAETAAWLAENFTCVAVDADAQPAVAALARHYLASVRQLAGLPMHLWLTPDLQVYEGYNYLPPSEEWGKPGYLKSARGALDAWTPTPARAKALAAEAMELMALPRLEGEIDPESRLARAAADWVKERDPVHGGFGTAPKQPEPELIRFLLHRGPEARQTAPSAARALAAGALRDPVDGGFHRRVLDGAWREPYFQKTLVDQARIALALLETAAAAGDLSLRPPAFGALDFVLRFLRMPDGGFAAGLDGTLEDPPAPPARPHFFVSGRATLGGTAHFLIALQTAAEAGEKRFAAAAAELRRTLRGVAGNGTGSLRRFVQVGEDADPADVLALATALRASPDDADRVLSGILLRRTIDRHLDPKSGQLVVSVGPHGAASAFRPPASGETPSAAALALAAGLGGAEESLMRRALLQGIVYDTLPAGDVLWALGLARNE